jgi:hypothetical protein
MSQAGVAELRIRETKSSKPWGPREFARAHWLALAIAGLVFVAAIYGTVLALNWPFEKHAIIEVLQARSARQVTIATFNKTYFPPGCVAENICFLHRIHKEKEPLITVQRLVMTTSWARILTLQRKLTLARIFNMHVTVPPSEPGKPNPIMPLTYNGRSEASVVIDRTIADGAVLDFLSKEPGKKPFRLTIDKLRLDGIGNNEPMYLAYRDDPERSKLNAKHYLRFSICTGTSHGPGAARAGLGRRPRGAAGLERQRLRSRSYRRNRRAANPGRASRIPA